MFFILFCLNLPIAYCLLPIAYCLLPIAYCLLAIAYGLFPIVYSLLPIAYCLLLPIVAYCLFAIAHWGGGGQRHKVRGNDSCANDASSSLAL